MSLLAYAKHFLLHKLLNVADVVRTKDEILCSQLALGTEVDPRVTDADLLEALLWVEGMIPTDKAELLVAAIRDFNDRGIDRHEERLLKVCTLHTDENVDVG